MQIYLVGGAVRDQLLNYPVYDKDWVVVGATADAMLAQGFQPVGKDFPVFIHPETGEEYALARTERKSGKGYTGFQYFASPEVTLEEDLRRRDLTINAIAQHPDGELVDPYNGRQDLQDKVLRHVSEAFAEDPLRVLRVARFYARYAHLGFTVADDTLQLMTQLSTSDELIHLTAERVWKETERALAERTPLAYLSLLHRCHALEVLFPEWLPLAETLLREDNITSSCPEALSAQEVFSFLMARATKSVAPEQRTDLIEQFCARLRTPKAWQEQASQVARWHEDFTDFTALDGETRFGIVQSLDLLRRPQRLPGVLAVCGALQPDAPDLLERFTELLDQLNALNPAELMADGFKGKALGDELARRRQQICQNF